VTERITATYRLQLTPGFTLFNAAAVAPYLHELGISDLYLSPVLEARTGSVHGYDVTDPARIRAELGGEAGFDALRNAARAAGLGIILDIVPNHMAASAENPWWRDLLEFGIDSPHARAFDLGWRSDADQRRLLLPVLGDDLAVVLGRGEIVLGLDEGGLLLRYADRFFPITPAAYGPVLRAIGAVRAARAFDALEPPPPLDGAPGAERRARALAVRDGWLVELAAGADAVAQALDAWNARPAGERVPVLRHVAEAQTYELAFWRRSAREIGYRRFFDITDLAGVRVDDGDVFRATHTRILSLVARGDVRGLRVDHVDGLRDPAQYLGRLAQAHRPRPALLVEKIVAPDEELRAAWPVDGTTGYEFANALGGWFIDTDGWRALRRAYVRFTGADVAFDDLAYDRQRRIIEGLFGGELRVLRRSLADLARRAGARLADAALEAALREVSACLSVYRTYITGWPVSAEDRERVERALADARRRAPQLDVRALAWLRSVLLLDQPPPLRAAALEFVLQWQQFTGPVMAKGFEDTALYNDFTLAAANEVGGHPDHASVAAAELHAFLARRAASGRAGLSATSTHDTKRSEDVRLRIVALTRCADEWTGFLDFAAAQAESEDPAVPAPADRVLLYQTLIGTWPEDPADPSWEERIRAYMTKAAREAKARTSWRDPDEAYEGALGAAVRRALDPAGPLYTRLDALARRVQRPAALASLAQTTIKCTAPGVPDFYQGSEDWLIALVDPDNRRPVDYEAARHGWTAIEPLLEGCDEDDLRRMLRDWRDGRIKRFITAAALRHRRACADLYAVGGYEPLPVNGPGAADVIAFARDHGAQRSITIARRWEPARMDPVAGTTIELPAGWPGAWSDVFTRRSHEVRAGALDARAILDPLPCAILVMQAGSRPG
jgi:(1->4)-alpha-D-glucan 1-alpha-D-glucosylmutase